MWTSCSEKVSDIQMGFYETIEVFPEDPQITPLILTY